MSDSKSNTLPESMKAVLMTDYGDASVMKYKEDYPSPKNDQPTQLIVKLRYGSVNPVDWKLRDGIARPFLPPHLPYVLGRDASGVVVAAGDEVKDFKIGDEVLGVFTSNGGYAQYVQCPENDLALKPKDLPWDIAGAIGLVTLTIYQMFAHDKDFNKALEKNQTGLLPNKCVLIVGASGGTGSFAVLLAKHYFGSRVYAVCGTDNVDYVKDLGADHVIDYKKQKFKDEIPELEKLHGNTESPFIDITLDCAGGAEEDAFEIMDPTGTFVTIAPPKKVEENGLTLGSVLMLFGGVTLNKLKNLTGLGPKYYAFLMHSDGKQLAQMSNWLVEKKLYDKIEISKKFALSDLDAAHRESEKGRSRGKILIDIPQE
jgi:alcohol dehydrogenase